MRPCRPAHAVLAGSCVLVIAAAAGVAGCDTGPGAGSPAAATAPASAARRSPALPETGAELAGLLPARAELPAGWAYLNPAGNENDSGDHLVPPPYVPVLSKETCQSMRGVDAPGLLMTEQASYAQLSLSVGSGQTAATGGVNVAGYYPGYAARQMSLIESLYRHRCGPVRFRDELTGAPVILRPTFARAHGIGGQALLIEALQANGLLPDGSYYPGDTVLVVRAGDYIADVDAPAFPGHTRLRQVKAIMALVVSRLRHAG